jgi:hypothetical protein
MIPLEAFLAALPAPEAAEARAAAARIDALERAVGPPGWLERHLLPLGLGALLLFTLGVLLLAGLLAGIGGIGLGAVLPLIAAFPLLVFAYLWSVRGRTRLDREKMALNERYFLPHGGIYFGERSGGGQVMPVERAPAEPTLRDRAHALYAEATRRRWWW